MRRQERKITSVPEMLDILQSAESGTLALVDGGKPYAVALNYGFRYENGILTLYFHGASAGRKIDCIMKNPRGCFLAVSDSRLVSGAKACNWTMHFRSVAVEGTLEILTDPAEKRRGLDAIMAHYDPSETFDYPAAMLERTAVIRLTAETFSGKSNPSK